MQNIPCRSLQSSLMPPPLARFWYLDNYWNCWYFQEKGKNMGGNSRDPRLCKYLAIWSGRSSRRYFQFSVVFEHRGENFEETSPASFATFATIFHFSARPATWREIFPRYVAATASWINHFFRVTIKYLSDRPRHVTQVRAAAGFKRGNIGRSEGLINHDTTKITIHRDKMGAIPFNFFFFY